MGEFLGVTEFSALVFIFAHVYLLNFYHVYLMVGLCTAEELNAVITKREWNQTFTLVNAAS